MPDKLYRFLEPCWADALCEYGRLRINSLDYFRQMEGAQRDEYDSCTHYASGRMFISDSSADVEKIGALGRAQVVIAPGCTDITINDVQFTSRNPGAALCFCRSENAEPFESSGKHAMVQVSDLEAFAYEVTMAANGRLGMRCAPGVVEYVSDIITTGSARRPDASPFRKRAEYADENEFRLYWPDAQDGPIDVESLRIAQLVVRRS